MGGERWFKKWRSEKGSGDESEKTGDRRGSGLLSWRKARPHPMRTEPERRDEKRPAIDPAGPLAHGLF
jgi:hypothetical protein